MKWFFIKYLDKLFEKLRIGRLCGHTIQCRALKKDKCSYIDYCCNEEHFYPERRRI